MAMKPDGTSDGNFVVEKGAQQVLSATTDDGYVQVGDPWRAHDIALGLDGGRTGMGLDSVKNDVSVEAVEVPWAEAVTRVGLPLPTAKLGVSDIPSASIDARVP
jgi:hypothetical protein